MAALLDLVKKGAVDRSVTLRIIDSADGTPETGVVFNSAGIDLWYRREGAALVSITEATLAALTTAHTDGGFLHIANGEYRLDLPDAAFATGANHVDVGGTVTGMVVLGGRVRLVDFDPEAATPAVNVTQIGGDAQSATDLKDFADAGYDPATNKVEGVKLADTLTTYTGNTPQTGDSFARIGANGAGLTAVALSVAGIQAIWDALTSALTAVGSIGKLLVDNVNATISSRSSHSAADVWAVATRLLTAGTNIVLAKGTGVTGFNDPTVADIADGVWEEALAGHVTPGSAGAALSAAGSAGDPWSTALPGAYGAGTAGKILGDNVDATISSRATPAQVNTEVDTALADYDAPTRAELTTDTNSVLAAIAALNNITANAAADAYLDRAAAVDGFTPRQILRLAAAVLAGKLSGVSTSAPEFRDLLDTKDRVVAVTTADGRTSVTLDLT